MTALALLGLVLLTSLIAYGFGTIRLRLEASGLRAATGRMLEGVGTILLCWGLNLAVGGTVVAAIRGLTGGFLSFYTLDDPTILVFSVLQGLTFQWWREGR